MSDRVAVRLSVNGVPREAEVPARLLLSDFLRDHLGLTGTHVGCEHGVCGACTVLVDGASARACLVLAAQADGTEVTTIEGLARDGAPHPVQRAFERHFALQCGFCTPGMIMAAVELLARDPDPSDDAIRTALGGNVCRCTGYLPIVAAIRAAAKPA